MGSIIAALGQPFLLNVPSKVASSWFGDKEVSYFKDPRRFYNNF